MTKQCTDMAQLRSTLKANSIAGLASQLTLPPDAAAALAKALEIVATLDEQIAARSKRFFDEECQDEVAALLALRVRRMAESRADLRLYRHIMMFSIAAALWSAALQGSGLF